MSDPESSHEVALVQWSLVVIALDFLSICSDVCVCMRNSRYHTRCSHFPLIYSAAKLEGRDTNPPSGVTKRDPKKPALA
ncbi:hypothetical protein Taro_037191, partial [Colocasia esculenta]|nr:hypothetical protein [Colocasia esculenta]